MVASWRPLGLVDSARHVAASFANDILRGTGLAIDGKIELAGIGESTEEYIMEACYPELQKALSRKQGILFAQ